MHQKGNGMLLSQKVSKATKGVLNFSWKETFREVPPKQKQGLNGSFNPHTSVIWPLSGIYFLLNLSKLLKTAKDFTQSKISFSEFPPNWPPPRHPFK